MCLHTLIVISMMNTIDMIESELNEIKNLLDIKEYDEAYNHIQSIKILLEVMRSKLDELLKH